MIPKKSLDSVLDISIILTIAAPNDNVKSISVQCVCVLGGGLRKSSIWSQQKNLQDDVPANQNATPALQRHDKQMLLTLKVSKIRNGLSEGFFCTKMQTKIFFGFCPEC